MKCIHCGSEKIEFNKYIGWRRKEGYFATYGYDCLNCNKLVRVKSTPEILSAVKDKLWLNFEPAFGAFKSQ